MTWDGALMQADELRLGLRGQVRRVLAPRGTKVVQRVQIANRWRYLLLSVNPRTGRLEPGRRRLGRAGAHRGKQLRDLPVVRVFLPPSSPELNLAERAFQEVRRRVEGRVYAMLDNKQAEVEAYLGELAADPARVRRLCGWDWLLAAFASLTDGNDPGGGP